MKTLQKFGGLAALYQAFTFLAGMLIFLVVLDYASITDPAQKVALLMDKRMVIFSTNLLMYVFFGLTLVVLSLALHERLKAAAPALMQTATAVGIIWAGSLVASGMVANAGIDPVVALYASDPAQAASAWQMYETIALGIGNFNGEILGGVWILLVSLAALRGRGLGRFICFTGIAAGVVGILSLLPFLTAALVSVFGLLAALWYILVGIALLRRQAKTNAS